MVVIVLNSLVLFYPSDIPYIVGISLYVLGIVIPNMYEDVGKQWVK